MWLPDREHKATKWKELKIFLVILKKKQSVVATIMGICFLPSIPQQNRLICIRKVS